MATEESSIPSKRCTKCCEAKPLTEFAKDGRARDERTSSCKSCNNSAGYWQKHRRSHPDAARVASAKWHAAHQDEIKARRARDRKDNPAKYREQSAKWMAANPVLAKEIQRRYVAAHPGRRAEISRRWQQANPGKVRSARHHYKKTRPEMVHAKEARRRARLLGAPGRGITGTQWKVVLSASLGLCVYCNEHKPLTLDHVEPLALGGAHDVDNAVAACRLCNSSKSSTPLVVWLAKRAAA